MSRTQQCATVQTQGDAQSHTIPETRTSPCTVNQQPSLKALAGAVLGRTTPRTMDAHCAKTPCTSSADDHHQGNVHDQAIDADLKRLIQAAADFWRYDADDLRLMLIAAVIDPDGIRRSLSSDPLKPFYSMGLDRLFDGVGELDRPINDPERKHLADD